MANNRLVKVSGASTVTAVDSTGGTSGVVKVGSASTFTRNQIGDSTYFGKIEGVG